MQTPIRVIMYFQYPISDSAQLSNAIFETCRCQLLFLRKYSDDALIYEITPTEASTFAAVAKMLMNHADRLGIKTVEQDRIMRHQ